MPLLVCKVSGPRADPLACATGGVVWSEQASALSELSYCARALIHRFALRKSIMYINYRRSLFGETF